MKINVSLLISGIVTAVLLLVSLIPTLAATPRYPSLDLAPIPVESGSSQTCSQPEHQPTYVPSSPLLDGTGIFQDTLLEGMIQAHPLVAPYAAEPVGCTISTASPAS